MAQHGNRQLARLQEDWSFETLATHYNGQRLNGPNEVVFKANGDMYFTDPFYGLEKQDEDPSKELSFAGIYYVRQGTNKVILLEAELSGPNGLAFSPDESKLYVANTGEQQSPAIWAYDVEADGSISHKRLLYDFSHIEGPGGPDGLKVDGKGNVWATGPGGVYVIDEDGIVLGTIKTGQIVSNVAFGGSDGKTLFMTSDMFLYSLPLL